MCSFLLQGFFSYRPASDEGASVSSGWSVRDTGLPPLAPCSCNSSGKVPPKSLERSTGIRRRPSNGYHREIRHRILRRSVPKLYSSPIKDSTIHRPEHDIPRQVANTFRKRLLDICPCSALRIVPNPNDRPFLPNIVVRIKALAKCGTSHTLATEAHRLGNCLNYFVCP